MLDRAQSNSFLKEGSSPYVLLQFRFVIAHTMSLKYGQAQPRMHLCLHSHCDFKTRVAKIPKVSPLKRKPKGHTGVLFLSQ